ncbi:MAG: lipid-A-disaccharide synthase [Planctomycetota bacterium]
MPPTIFFSVGEPSGDQHAARLARCLTKRHLDVQIRGFGGPAMLGAGCQLDRDLTQHAVVGILEVLPKIRQFFGFADQAEEIFRAGNVDAVVLVDFPGFNWHIAKRAKKFDIPVYYYCPPQLWAWGGWRVHKMRRSVDHVMAVLPIEVEYFGKNDIPATYVGHPFFDAVDQQVLNPATLTRLSRLNADDGDLIAVLPGSRTHEVHRNFPIMLDAIRRLHDLHPNAHFAVAAYRDQHCLWCRDQMTDQDRELPIQYHVGSTSEIIEAAKCAMMVSGSVSLELMARRTPAAVIYRVGRFLHEFGKRVIKVDSLTLPNLMNDRKVFPEFVSAGSVEPAVEFLTASIDAMLSDHFYFNGLMKDLDRLRESYAMPGATAAAADFLGAALDLAPPHYHRVNDPSTENRARAA